MKKLAHNKYIARFSRYKATLLLVSVILVGAIYVLISQAATSVVSYELESGNITSPATQISSSGTSGNGAVRFSLTSQITAMNIDSTLNSLGDPDPSGIINEASGLIMSRKNNSGSIFWTHNDSSTSPTTNNVIYAISPGKGILATVRLSGTSNVDWEDIAIGPGPIAGKDYIYVGNIGSSAGSARKIYRIEEPVVNVNQAAVSITIATTDVDTYSFTLPFNDAEGFFIDPITGDGFIFQKVGGSATRPITSPVYRMPAAQFVDGGGALTLAFVANVRTLGVGNTNDGGITAADISADGKYFAISNYQEIWAWSVNRAAGETISSVLVANSVGPYHRLFGSGWGSESITFSPDRSRFYTLAEGSGSSLKYVNLTY